MSAVAVSFRYGRRRPLTLDGISISFQRGVTVVLGPNGAGKSTLLKICAGVLTPLRGTVGFDSSDQTAMSPGQLRRDISLLPQDVTVMPGFTVREQIAYSGWLKGMSKSSAWTASLDAVSEVRLDEIVSEKVARLSGGQRRRVGIAGAIVSSPTALLMDEPTVGLDPSQRRSFRLLASRLAEERTVVIASHQTDDLDKIADHVAVVSGGTSRWAGSIENFLSVGGPEGSVSERAERAYAEILESNA